MLCGLQAGCTDPGWDAHQAPAPGAAISDRSIWRAAGEGLAEPHKAFDGDKHTAAIAPGNALNARLTIDLGKPCIFNTIIIDNGEGSWPGQLTVSTSTDGREYTQRHVGPGTRRFTIISLIRPTLARYIRLQATSPAGGQWEIHELYLQ
jgi:hypothetical protein